MTERRLVKAFRSSTPRSSTSLTGQRERGGTIIELTVPDRLVNPHDEVRIAQHVRDFGVEVLNWRFLDISIPVFEDMPEARNRITELHLYTNGKRAVISHWLSEGGVASLPNVSLR